MTIDKLLHHRADFTAAYGPIDLFISKTMKEDLSLDDNYQMNEHVMRVIDSFIESQEFYSGYVDMYAKLKRLKGVAILSAHGDVINPDLVNQRSWVYDDGESSMSMQNWIDHNDGKYAALVLHSCNVGHCDITSKKSIVLPFTGIYSGVMQSMGEGSVELYVPGKEYLDSNIIESEFNELAEKLDSRKKRK